MHRSGTSVIAGILNRLGIEMGDKYGKGIYNPLGFFEDPKFRDLNRKILKEAGGRWDQPPNEEIIYAQRDKFTDEIKNLIEDKPKIWGWKDPRNCLTIELYIPYLNNPYFIVCYRKPAGVTQSFYRRYKMEYEKVIKLKKIYDERIENFFKKYPKFKRFDVYYEKIISNPKEFVDNILNFLDISIKRKEYNKAIKFIKPLQKVRKISKRLKIKKIIKEGIMKPWKIPSFIFKDVKISINTLYYIKERAKILLKILKE